MNNTEASFVIIFIFANAFIFLKGFWECYRRTNAYGATEFLFILGIYVWGDAAIFGIYWTLVGLVSLYLNNWILFLLFYSVFWIVRSLGETVYWFNQQFTTKISDPSTLRFYKYFRNDSIWFIYQIFHQSIMVFAIIASIYLVKKL